MNLILRKLYVGLKVALKWYLWCEYLWAIWHANCSTFLNVSEGCIYKKL